MVNGVSSRALLNAAQTDEAAPRIGRAEIQVVQVISTATSPDGAFVEARRAKCGANWSGAAIEESDDEFMRRLWSVGKPHVVAWDAV